MKELPALLLVLLVTASGTPQFNRPGYSVGPQKYVRDEYGQYHPVSGFPGNRPFHQGGPPSHAASSFIHGQPGFPQVPSQGNQFHQGFPSFQQGFPSNQNQFPSNQNQFVSQFPPHGSGSGDVPVIPLPPNPNKPNRPSVIPGVNTQGGSGIDISQFARNRPGAATEPKKDGGR